MGVYVHVSTCARVGTHTLLSCPEKAKRTACSPGAGAALRAVCAPAPDIARGQGPSVHVPAGHAAASRTAPRPRATRQRRWHGHRATALQPEDAGPGAAARQPQHPLAPGLGEPRTRPGPLLPDNTSKHPRRYGFLSRPATPSGSVVTVRKPCSHAPAQPSTGLQLPGTDPRWSLGATTARAHGSDGAQPPRSPGPGDSVSLLGP